MTFLLISLRIVLHKKNGIRTSSTMFIFWFLLVFCSLPHYITELQRAVYHRNTLRLYPYISNMLYFPVIVYMFVLEFFVDSRPILSKYSFQENSAPEVNVSFICNLYSAWYDSFAVKYHRKKMELTDLFGLKYDDKLNYLVPLFYKYWNQKSRDVRKKCERQNTWNKINKLTVNGYQKSNERYEQLKDIKEISIIPVIWKCFSTVYLSISILKLVVDILMFVNPQILRLLINFEQSNEPLWRGYLYMFALVFVSSIQSIFLNSYVSHMFKFGLRLRSVLMAVIFRKVLKISNSAKRTFTLGDISNLMSVDAQRFYDLSLYLNIAISAPFTILTALYFLWILIGVSAIAGVGLMLIIVLINGAAAGKIKQYQTDQMKLKDERIKITNEVLSGIKVLKMYAWENSFEKKITDIRNSEIKMLKKAAYVNTAISFVWTTAPFLVSWVTFTTFIFIDNKNVLTAEIAFVSLALFNIMKIPISLLPRFLTNIVQAVVATKRINKFLNSDELNPTVVSHNENEIYPLIMEQGTFTWDETDNRPTLSNININVQNGNLVAIVGPVGSGKTSLLSAFLGEMIKLKGRVNTKGSIAYVSQQAWLQNATLRDNILFNIPYKVNLYNKVVESCALLPDFQVLPARDFTEIGEKGVNLSGGQKQRISLARSVYSDADVYFLDDPLSAVDTHVGKHIFEKVIGPQGILRKKTRLLVTNAITYLSDVDYIIVMKNGVVVDSGSYNDLMAKQGTFADYIAEFSQEDKNAEFEVPLETNKLNFGRQNHERTMSEDDEIAYISNIMSPELEDDYMVGPTENEKLIEKEVAEEGKIKLSIYWYYIRSGGLLLWCTSIIFNILYQSFSVSGNLWLTEWSTDPQLLSNNTQNTSKKYTYLRIYSINGLLQITTVSLATLAVYLATATASKNLHNFLIGKVLRWPAYIFDITPLGRILNRFSYDIDVLDNTIPFVLRQLFTLAGTMLSTLFVISYSSPIFILLLVPLMIIYVFIEQIYVGLMRQLKRMETISLAPVYSYFSETVTGAPLIRAYGMQNNFILEAEQKITTNQLCTNPTIHGQKWIGLRLDNIGIIIIFLSSFFAVLEKGVVNAGVISLSVTYALQITGSLNWVIRSASEIETSMVSVERIKGFQKTPEENQTFSKCRTVPKAWPNNGIIIFDKYKTRYREGLDFVLRGIDLRIESGEKIGIVGRTGAGKSSLTLSLFRIIEATEGRILIDNIDISEIDLKVLRSRITVIPQDPVLFSGSVRLNLDPFFEHYDQELWHVLELAHLKDYIMSLPQGLCYKISENGGNLSIGQRQLICLARALLRKTKVLVLDEATAAIDLETDDLIQKTIRKQFRECTVLTIAHKLNTIMDSDRIVVLDQGLVKEFDTPTNLLKLKTSIFYSMVKQAGLV